MSNSGLYTKKEILEKQAKIKHSDKELLDVAVDKVYQDLNGYSEFKSLNLSKKTVRRFLLRNLATLSYTRIDLIDSLLDDFVGVEPGTKER